MKTKFQAVCFFYLGRIYFLCQVSLSESQVILVTRNVTDSFRIGKDGCKGNKRVCTDAQASCQGDDGSCLCKNGYPNFRNPTKITRNSTVQYGDSYGCMDNLITPVRVGKISCKFRSYQVIPNNHQEPATRFTNDYNHERPKICDYRSAEAKYPNNNTQINLSWLNKTYIEFNNSGDDRTWYFKWKKSVPKLEGVIVTIVFHCTLRTSAFSNECLQAKVFGTWRSSSSSTNPQPTSSQPTASDSPTKSSSTIASNSTIAGSSTIASRSTIATTSTATSPNPSNPGNAPSKEDKPNTTIVVVAVVVPLVVVIIIILVVCCLLKRKKNRKTVYKRSTCLNNYDNCHVNRGLFYGPGSDTADITADQTTPVKSLNSEYETPDVNIDRNKVNRGSGAVAVTPANQTTPVKILNSEYETPDVNIDRNKVIGGSGAVAVTPADQATPVKILNSEYETPDVNLDRNKVKGDRGATAVTPVDQAAPTKNLKAEYATPDDGIERIEVNGDLYAVPVNQKNKKTTEKNNDKPNEVQYMDPQKLALVGVKDEGHPSQPTEYAEISGFLQPVDE